MPSLSGKVSALPTEEVIAFPFGEGVGFADERGHSLPFRKKCRLCRRKRTLPSPSGKVSALPTEEDFAFLFGKGVGIAGERGHSLPLRGRCRLCRRKRTMRQKVSPLGGVYLSFKLNWEECRCRETSLSIEIQYGKEGLPQI